MGHPELVTAAELWLRCCRKHSIVLADVHCWTWREHPDAIGWRDNGLSTIIECKNSRVDFKLDAKKWSRQEPQRGMGYERYYFTPEGVIGEGELPDGWGLVEVTALKQPIVRRVSGKFVERNERAERALLINALRRSTEGWGLRLFGELTPDAHAAATAHAFDRAVTLPLMGLEEAPGPGQQQRQQPSSTLSSEQAAIVDSLRRRIRRLESALADAHENGCSEYTRWVMCRAPSPVLSSLPLNTLANEKDARIDRRRSEHRVPTPELEAVVATAATDDSTIPSSSNTPTQPTQPTQPTTTTTGLKKTRGYHYWRKRLSV